HRAPVDAGVALRLRRGPVAGGVAVPVVAPAVRVGLLVVRPCILAAIVPARGDAVPIAHVIREIRSAPLARRIWIVGLVPLIAVRVGPSVDLAVLGPAAAVPRVVAGL